MYQVKIYHHRKAIVKGDLEDELVMINSKVFSTRKSAKGFIERQAASEARYASKPTIRRDYHKGDEPSHVYLWTGDEWQHENSGEMCQEYYIYKLEKVKVK